MKTNVTLKEFEFRTKAISNNEIIKTVPQPFVKLVQSLGYIDVRSDKMILSAMERVLLIIYNEVGKYDNIENFKGLENIEILYKNFINMRYGVNYYTVSIKDGPEVKIGYDEFKSLDVEEKTINRWA